MEKSQDLFFSGHGVSSNIEFLPLTDERRRQLTDRIRKADELLNRQCKNINYSIKRAPNGEIIQETLSCSSQKTNKKSYIPFVGLRF